MTYTDERGEYIWRTVGGRRIKIYKDQTLEEAMRESGKFPNSQVKTIIQQRKTISGVIIGTKTRDGLDIKSIRDHAMDRMTERGFGASQVKGVLQSFDPTPGNKPDRNVYENSELRVIIGKNGGELVTVIRKKRRSGQK